MEGGDRRILVVDDERAVRLVLVDYLTAHGYRVDAAAEETEAEACLGREAYALVIADLNLGGGTGSGSMLDFVRRTRERLPATRVVLFTGSGGPEVEAEGARVGARAVLYKPLPLPELLRIVAAVIATRA